MKKLIDSFKFLFKASALIAMLMVGWMFVNVTSLIRNIKGDADHKKGAGDGELFKTNRADADVAGGPGPVGCPHVAYFNGREFKIENDFLLGKPKSFLTDFASIRSLYEQGRVGPDLLKFTHGLGRRNGKITLQLQEIEAEETFVDWVKLIRVLHPAGTEVVADSGFRKFYAVERNATEKNILLPSTAALNGERNVRELFTSKAALWGDVARQRSGALFQPHDVMEFTFKSVRKGSAPFLIVKSMFRDWMMGDAEGPNHAATLHHFRHFRHSKNLSAAALASLALFLFLEKKIPGAGLAFIPLIGGGQGCTCGCGGYPQKSIAFSYLAEGGVWNPIVIHEPRDWKYGLEAISLPREAVRSDGSVAIKAEFTKRHNLGFIGLLENLDEKPYRDEVLPVQRAVSSRTGDVMDVISRPSERWAHMIPGDTVDIEFGDPALEKSDGETETYLMQSSGFYTMLRPEYKKIAGDWRKKLSPEAETHYRELAEIRSYH